MDAAGLPAGLGVSRAEDGYRIGGVADGPTGVYDAVVTVSDGTLTAQAALRITVRQEGATLGYTGDLLSSTGSPTGTRPTSTSGRTSSRRTTGHPEDLTRADVVFDYARAHRRRRVAAQRRGGRRRRRGRGGPGPCDRHVDGGRPHRSRDRVVRGAARTRCR